MTQRSPDQRPGPVGIARLWGHPLAAKLNELERKIAAHDKDIVALFQAVRSLMAVPEKPTRRIGFRRDGT